MADHSERSPTINSWLQDELYYTWRHDQRSVDDSWKKFFEGNGAKPAEVQAAPAPGPVHPNGAPALVGVGAPAPSTSITPAPGEVLQPLRGVAAKIAENMFASLSVPTATSQRLIAVRALEENRSALNQALAASGRKLSYTHLISWAIVRALAKHPGLNDAYLYKDGEHFRLVRRQINLGIAVDTPSKDGSSSLLVPNIKDAGAMNFAQFAAAFDDIVSRARAGKLQMADFQGTTISLTNPGTVGTYGSVPRLMPGQGAIIATGALDYPAEFRGVAPETLRSLGISKVMMLTCTYDHRVIQGADSGRFLATLESLLNGEDGFYESIFRDLDLSLPAKIVQAAPVESRAVAADIAVDARKEAAITQLIEAYRERGHLAAQIDPLGQPRPAVPELDPATYGLTAQDMEYRSAAHGNRTLREIIEKLRLTYCEKIGSEYWYIHDPEQREWLRQRIEPEQFHWELPADVRIRALERLLRAEEFEKFLDKRFIGKKRFGLEGGESAILALDEILERAANAGAQEAVIGMAHRGRLNVLANVVGKPLDQVFAEFEEAPHASTNTVGSGDVKYHLGASGKHRSLLGREITVSVSFNPSHLEAVDPVVEGIVRSKQDQLGQQGKEKIIPILIHGDAAFIGQGVVAETLNLSQLAGFHTGGTIHLIINNQLGFTTPPSEGRSCPYASEVAKMIQAPIFHVNGDVPQSVLRVAQLAFEYRQRFQRDVVIDIVCYRRHGHNEGDDPSFTQPVMYRQIRQHPSVAQVYAERLIREGVISAQEVEERKKRTIAELSAAYDLMKKHAETIGLEEEPAPPVEISPAPTSVPRKRLETVIQGLTRLPDGFHLHPKLKGFLERRREALKGAPMDWATAEALAFGTLLLEGTPVRLTGQDSGRGTFSQRHLELFDYENGALYVPMKHLDSAQAPFEVIDSPLSEFAVMGFEFGYSLAHPRALVLWEAQFGDFVNGAQIIVDQFISSAELKWGQPSGLVLLLPHGYEGQGPEHSSARIERFLQLCAEGNMQVANCTTPAQYFHLLRRQMMGGRDGGPVRKPLVIFTPKSLLRHARAVSHLEDLTRGAFHEVMPDTDIPSGNSVKRILFCSGKVYYDLLAGREQRKALVPIVRVEQLYPFPQAQLADILHRYPKDAEVMWVQEEPRNMGPWRFMQENFQGLLEPTKRTLLYAGRPESASPAAGTTKRHEAEQALLVEDAFAPTPVVRKPRRLKAVRKK